MQGGSAQSEAWGRLVAWCLQAPLPSLRTVAEFSCSKGRDEKELLCLVNLFIEVALYQTATRSWELALRGGQADTQLIGFITSQLWGVGGFILRG